MSMVKTVTRVMAFLVPFLAVSSLHALSLDSFDGPAFSLPVSSSAPVASGTVEHGSIIGYRRAMKSSWMSGPLTMRIEGAGGFLYLVQDPQTSGKANIQWDGNSTPGDVHFSGLGGIDMTQDGGTAFRLLVESFDYALGNSLPIKLTVYDASDPSGETASSRIVTLNSSLSQATLLIPFSDFAQTGLFGPANFANIGAVSMLVGGNTSDWDMVLDDFDTNGQCDLVPDQNGRVIDDCQVCGGNNSDKDECGVCFGDNSSCADCAGVPNGEAEYDVCGECGGDGTSCLDCNDVPNGGAVEDVCGVCDGNGTSCLDCNLVPNGGAVVDICGVCAGDGTSCLDCHNVPFGPGVLDRCGVCDGDGFSCCECTESDISAALADMSSKTLKQYKYNLREILRLLKANPKLKKKLNAENKALYAQVQALIAEIPAIARVCKNTEFCVRVETNQQRLRNYKLITKKLARITRKIPRPKGGVCTRTAAECRATSNNADKLMRVSVRVSSKVPGVTSVCD